MKPEQPTPAYVPGHSLLEGRVVVVTAAAGAGIGAAVVRKVLEEGAKAVVMSDTHERRLKESCDALAEEFGEDRITAVTCDVTQEDQVQALLDAVVKAKPATAKGKYVKKVNLAATMSPGVLLDETAYAK